MQGGDHCMHYCDGCGKCFISTAIEYKLLNAIISTPALVLSLEIACLPEALRLGN